MNKYNIKRQGLAAVIIMSALTCMSVAAEITAAAPAFSPDMLKQFQTIKRDGLSYPTIYNSFNAFTPTTPEHVDWCYLALAKNVPPEIRMAAQKKLEAMRDPVLLAASRKHIFDNDKVTAKMALQIIAAAQDQSALSELRKVEGIKEEPTKQLYYLIRQTRAKLHDPELLKELTDSKKQTPDSTLAMYNRELLREYGEEGMKLLLSMEQNSQASRAQVDAYVGEIRDKNQVADLLKRYNETGIFGGKKGVDNRKAAILKSLMNINSRECQPLFREILAKNERESFENIELRRISMCVWKYNLKEAEVIQKQYLDDLKTERSTVMHELYWPQYKDGTPEIALALVEKLKNPKNGHLAAAALQRITGQQFQYAAPASDWARKKADARAGKTSLTPEDIERKRQYDLQKMNIHLEEQKRSGMREDHYAYYAKSKIDGINREYDELLKSAGKSSEWKRGIPIDQAVEWLRNYYHIQSQGNVKNEKK